MKQRACIVLWCVIGLLSPGAHANSDDWISLNNEGVKAVDAKDWQLASSKFEAALKLNPHYELAQKNLIVMHGQHGVQLRQDHKFAEALKELHQAAYAEPYWTRDLFETIEKMGKNPKSFEVRVELAEQARRAGDNRGAVVEYRAALYAKNDAGVHKKLGDLYEQLGDKENSTFEYERAKKIEQREASSHAP